jgi:tRNA-2-methylthio-N6-dimethylallyladenosine synthase
MAAENNRAFAILTWGCQMNEDDSEQIATLLTQMGYSPTDNVEDADIIMLNTCSVRAKPEQKVRSKLGELRELKAQKPDIIIGVCGCMAQKEGLAIRRRAPHVDLVVGTANISRIPEMICQVNQRRHPLSALDLPRKVSDDALLPGRTTSNTPGIKAFLPIMYGCDNFCAYCVVPHVRGKERSRPLLDIVSEAADMIAQGCKEITLLGQNVNSYGQTLEEPVSFAALLRELNGIGVERIRFMTSHPKDLSSELINAMAELEHVCEHIHLPVQSGDDEVLQGMRRGYTIEKYREKLARLREAVPDISVTTDFIVGFPGETEQQFENTLKVVQDLRFDAAFMFAYNLIPNTAAAKMQGQVGTAEKNARLGRLIELQNAISVEKNISEVGREFEVLVEGSSPKGDGKLTGLTRQNKTVNFSCDRDIKGQLVRVRAVRGHLWGFSGDLV